MGRFSKEDIFAFNVNQMVVCPDCITDDEEKELTLDDVILESEVAEDEIIFCDRHKGRLN